MWYQWTDFDFKTIFYSILCYDKLLLFDYYDMILILHSCINHIIIYIYKLCTLQMWNPIETSSSHEFPTLSCPLSAFGGHSAGSSDDRHALLCGSTHQRWGAAAGTTDVVPIFAKLVKVCLYGMLLYGLCLSSYQILGWINTSEWLQVRYERLTPISPKCFVTSPLGTSYKYR